MSRQSVSAVFAVLSLAFGFGAARAEDRVLNVYNWSDYIGPTTLADFEKATGIKVNYDTFDTNEMLEGKLKAGNSGYDIVVPSLTPFMARDLKGGFFQKLDKSKLPNYSHLDPGLLKRIAEYDPGNEYAIPWLTGTNGIGYNIDMVKKIDPNAPVDSLAFIFDPDILSKFKDCGISILDSPTDVFPSVLYYLHLDPHSKDPADLKKAADVLLKIRPYIRRFSSSEYINDLANGDVCVVWGYSTDVNIARRRAQEAGKGVKIQFVNPKEGGERYIDTMVIPKDAPHVAEAHAFLNFLMDPKVMAPIADALFAEPGNADAKALIKPEIVADPTIFPPPEVEAKLFTVAVNPPDAERLQTRLWTQIKTGH